MDYPDQSKPKTQPSLIRFVIIVVLILAIFAYLFYTFMEWNLKMMANPNKFNLYLDSLINRGVISQLWINNHRESIVKLVLPPSYGWSYQILRFNIIYQWEKRTS